MPAPKTYTKAQWDEFVRILDALPEKPPSERRITVRNAMPNVRVHIDAARAKGYSVEQLIGPAKQAGIDVTASALRYALQESKKRGATTRRAGGTVGASSRNTNSSLYQSSKREANQKATLVSQAKTEGDHSKPGSMEVQDAYSFKIRPDIEDI